MNARTRGAHWAHRMLDSAAARTIALPWLPKPGLISALRRVVGDPVCDPMGLALRAPRKRAAVLFIVGDRASGHQERVAAQAWSLEAAGVSTSIVRHSSLNFARLVESFPVFVLDGVSTDAPMQHFLTRARDAGRLVIVDGAELAASPVAGPGGLRDALARRAPQASVRRSLAINWVMRAPLAERSGSSQTIFRIANEMGRRGHRVRVYVDPVEHLAELSPGQIVDYLERNFGPLAVEPMIGRRGFSPSDATIATCWRTADSIVQDPRSLFRFRFFQDFEEGHYAAGHRYHHRANRAYRLPIQPITLGASLAERLAARTGQAVDSLDLGIETAAFHVATPPAERGSVLRVLFYARPELRQRGYALGIEALAQFHARFPEAEIVLFGAMEETLGRVPFAHTCIGIPSRQELAREMNRAHILLSLSLSEKISWVPLQAMACGAAVVETDACGLRDVMPEGAGCRIADANAESITAALSALASDAEARIALAVTGAREMARHDWGVTIDQFEATLLRRCFATTERIERPAHLVAKGAVGK
ncbi:MAG: glycosyltransferase family 4 protein [Deltaproteobacteria bacterium]